MGAKGGEVALLAGAHPDGECLRLGPGQVGRERGWDASLPLPVTPRDADEAGVVGFRRERLRVRRQLIEELADPVVHASPVDDGLERRELRGTRGLATRRHPDVEVPFEHPLGALKIRDLAEALP